MQYHYINIVWAVRVLMMKQVALGRLQLYHWETCVSNNICIIECSDTIYSIVCISYIIIIYCISLDIYHYIYHSISPEACTLRNLFQHLWRLHAINSTQPPQADWNLACIVPMLRLTAMMCWMMLPITNLESVYLFTPHPYIGVITLELFLVSLNSLIFV